jgi:hypothetical protein
MKASSSHLPAAAERDERTAVDASVASSSPRIDAQKGRRPRTRLHLDPFQSQEGFGTRCRRAVSAWLARARETPAA